MEEIWKKIEDSDGHYFISNLGRMYREEYDFIDKGNRHQHREIKVWEQGNFNKKNGYYVFRYRNKNGDSTKEYCHRLVALHFINNPCPEDYDQVNHIDGDKSHNYETNLEWCNTLLNMKHASEHGLINTESEKRKIQCAINARIGAEKNRIEWCCYNKEGELVKINKGGKAASVRRLTYKGLTWRNGEVLKEKYGEIPEHLDVSHSFRASKKSRKYYVSTDINGNKLTYEKLSELPISRDDLWYFFNHQIPDNEGRTWEINVVGNGVLKIDRKYETVPVYGYNENKELVLTFDSLINCLNYLNIKGSSSLNKAIKDHTLYHGYYWRKGDKT